MSKKSILVATFTVLAFVFQVFPLQASAARWEFDRAHSSVNFTVRHIFAPVAGVFEEFSGKIVFDPDNLKESLIEVEIQVGSVDTRNEKRDRHLESDDFFSARQYPVMKFASREIVHKEARKYVAKGQLTIKDVTKDIELPFTFLGAKENPFKAGEWVAGFESRYRLGRLEYNVGDGKYYKQGVVGKDVSIAIYLELLRPGQP